MENQIFKYLCLLEYLLNKTKFCLDHFDQLTEKQIEYEIDNRSRIINQLHMVSGEIQNIINSQSSKISEDQFTRNLLIAFQNDSELLYHDIDYLDRCLIERLENQADLTKNEIKQTFISSNRLKGYNLNQTR
ncbi:MAG: hypothetical protein H6622_02705 [Halobacteriovoraceae bacterium]|nr:hypothetical protein [Halobacteriovoraceae bacterium]